MNLFKKRNKSEKKVSVKNKSIIPGVIFISLLAAIIAFVILLNIEKNVLTDYEKGLVVVASMDIPEGELITLKNINQYMSLVEIDKKLISEDMITEVSHLENMMTLIEIKAGSIITGNLFDSLDSRMESLNKPVVAGFNSEDLYQVVSGVLRAGDTINIYIVDEEEKQATLGWENIYVLQSFDTAGTEIAAEDTLTAAQRINILMEQKQVEEFYSRLAQGSLRVVKIID